MDPDQMDAIKFEVRARAAANDCTFELFGTAVHVHVDRDKRDAGGRLYYQAVCPSRPDAFTGLPGEGRGGKAYLSPAMLDDELVQLCWGLLEAYVHHEAREGFRWRGKQIYGPHMKVANLAAIAEDIAVRPPAEEPVNRG
jgi:hypothetical protein